MKKLAFLSVAAVVFVSLFSFVPAYASGHSVVVTYSGEKQVKAGCSYNYQFTVTATQINALQLDFQFNGCKLASCDIEILTYENKDAVKTGELTVNIGKDVNPGDTVTVTAKGRFSWVGDDPTASCYAAVDYPLVLTVAADEAPTPSPAPTPTPTPEAPVSEDIAPSEAPQASSQPADEPSPSAKPASHAKESPLQTVSPAATPSHASSSDHTRSSLTTLSMAASSIASPQPSLALDPLSIQLDAMVQCGSVTYTAESPAALTAEMLEALRAKQGVLVVNMGRYSWTINGTTLGKLTGSVSLDMEMTNDASLSEAAGGRDIYQLHFSHTGDFPGRFVCRFAAHSNKPGDTLCLYGYHAASGLAEFKQNAIVDENGYAAFDIYEGGGYFVTLSDEQIPSSDEHIATETKPTDGDIWPFLISALCGVGGAALLLAVLHRKGMLTFTLRSKGYTEYPHQLGRRAP